MSEQLLEVRDLETFYGKSHILRGVSLSVGKGELVALLGLNGAGKTTTMRSIVGLTRAQSTIRRAGRFRQAAGFRTWSAFRTCGGLPGRSRRPDAQCDMRASPKSLGRSA